MPLDVHDLAPGRCLNHRLRRGKLHLELAAGLDAVRHRDLHRLTSSRIDDAHRLAGTHAGRAGHDHGWRHGLCMNNLRGDGLVVGRGL